MYRRCHTVATTSKGRCAVRYHEDNRWLGWFKIAMWIGIIANLAFAIPALFGPDGLLERFRLPFVKETIWVRDAGGLLLFLSLMYIGAARDPFRYRLNALLAVVGRVFFAVFWFWMICYADLSRAFLTLAIGDAVIGAVQATLYLLMMRHEYLQPAIPEDALLHPA
jgi:hypothetical protein